MREGLAAVVLDTQPDTIEEIAWASDTLADIPTVEEEEGASPQEEEGMSSKGSRKPSKDRKRGSLKDGKGSASQQLASQMSGTSEEIKEEQPPVQKRETRELAAETSAAYIQALRQMMDSDEANFGDNLDNLSDSVAVSVAGGAVFDRLNISVNGFTGEETKRMQVAFQRFKAQEGNEIHKDDLGQALRFLGYMKVDNDVCRKLSGDVSTYSMLDWQEYNDFVEKFAAYEREEFLKEFALMDEDDSGQLSVSELQNLISSLGVTPFKETLDEAMAVVDFDRSGQLDFDEFVHLMSVYRVTEGFTRKEVAKLRTLFDRVAVPVPGSSKEVKADRLQDIMVYMFGPQSIGLAMKLARRFTSGNHTDPTADDLSTGPNACPASPECSQDAWVASKDFTMPGIPFQEFLLWARRLREAEIEEFRKQFAACDADNSGFIGAEELRQVITNVGYMPLRTVVKEVLEQVDVDHNSTLDFDEFVNLMAVFRKTDGFCAREVQEYKDIFDQFKEDFKDGPAVNCLELMDVMRAMGYVTNLDVVRKSVKQVDFDNSNTIDLPEFIRLMRMFREHELNQALKAFNEELDSGSSKLQLEQAKRALGNLGYNSSDEMLAEATKKIGNLGGDEAEVEVFEEFDFDSFVILMDILRKDLMEVRRKNAGYSDTELDRYKKAFEVYDEDGNGDIERHELTNLLVDLGIPMRSKQEQQQMLKALDVARNDARVAGVEEELLGNMGDPAVTFNVMLFLVRALLTAADHAEVDRDRQIMDKTKFTPKEAEEFREIFSFWAEKAAALDDGKAAPEEAPAGSPGKGLMTPSGGDSSEAPRIHLLTEDGMKRVVRSLGLIMTPQERHELDEKLKEGPTDKENPGKYGFFEFLVFMRWMLDTNFAHINEAVCVDSTT